MRWRLILISRGGARAIPRHLRHGNVTSARHVERRRRGFLEVNFGVLLDDGPFLKEEKMNDNARLSDVYRNLLSKFHAERLLGCEGSPCPH